MASIRFVLDQCVALCVCASWMSLIYFSYRLKQLSGVEGFGDTIARLVVFPTISEKLFQRWRREFLST